MKYIHTSKIRRFNAIRHERGAVGCGLSQIAILEMAISENWDNVFIAEDDLTWTEHFANGHDILEKLMRKDYDVIVLGGTFVKSYKNSFKLISCNCALSYIVNKPYYQTLLKCFKNAVNGLIKTNKQSKYAIDQAWKELQRRDNWYIIKPIMCTQLPSYSDIENTYKDYTEYFNSKILEYDYEPNLEFSKLRYENDDRFNDNRNTDWWKPKRLMPNTYFSVYDPPNNTPQTPDRVDFQGPSLNTHFSVNESSYTKIQSAAELEEAKRLQQIREAEEVIRREQTEELTFYPPKHTSFVVNESPHVIHTQSIEQPDFQRPTINTHFTVNHESDIRYEDPDQVVFQRPKGNKSGTLNKISVTIYQPLNQTGHADQVAFQPPNSSTYFSVNESLATRPPVVEKVAFQTPPPSTYFSVNESLADQPPLVEEVAFQPPKDNKYFTVKETPYTKPPPTNQPIFQRQKNTPVPPVNKIQDTIIPPSSKLVSFRQLINLSKTN